VSQQNLPARSRPPICGATLRCFTPPIMLATMIIETALAVYVLIRYRKGMFAKVSIALLLLLAAFQLAEYQICAGREPFFWSRFGLAAITFLPLLGLYLVSLISHKKHFLALGYTVAAAAIVLIVFIPRDMVDSQCGGNYVLFSGPEHFFHLYSVYYFGFLLLGIWEAVEAMGDFRAKTLRSTLRWVVIGDLSFMLPMGVVFAIYPPARLAVASIMCGFAVSLAFILAFRIVPRYYKYAHGAAGRH
jgi:hypothetical protein